MSDSQLNAGYTSHGISTTDRQDYAGDPAYSSKEVALSLEQYQTLKDF